MTRRPQLSRLLTGRRAFGLLAAVFLVLLGLSSESRASATLSVDRTSDAEVGPEIPAYFSAQPAAIPLVLSGASSCPTIAATLLQVSARLEVEITQGTLLDCAQSTAEFDAGVVRHSFHFTVPKVSRETRFEWRYSLCDAAGQSCKLILSTPFLVYPADLLDPLRAWSEREGLFVRDPDGQLAEFLDRQKIDFVERVSGLAKGARVVSFLVDEKTQLETDDLAPYLEKGSVVVFREQPESLPMIKNLRMGNRPLVLVELPLITKLQSSPRAQRALLQIFQMLLEGADNT